MSAEFMGAKETAEYLNMSVAWVYRDAPALGLTPYKFGRGRNAKIQFRVSEVKAWVSSRSCSEVAAVMGRSLLEIWWAIQ